MKKVSCQACSNTNCFVRFCSDDWIQQIDLRKSQIFYKKHQNIVIEGSPVLGVFFILKGKVKVLSNGINGREQIVRLATDGHILGHRGIGNDVYPISAVAMEDSFVCFIENHTLNEMFLANPKFLIELMMYYSRELRKIESRFRNLSQMNVREKTAETLLLMLEIFGVNKNNELNVTFSREDIANSAGSTRQQITMQLTEFEKDGFIKKCGKKVAMQNVDGLHKILSKYNQHPSYQYFSPSVGTRELFINS